MSNYNDFVEIEGYENRYSINKNGEILNLKTGKKLNPYKNPDGYRKVTFYETAKKRKFFYVHRLLAKAFIENPLNKDFINHINGNTSDNRIENLEWCTRSENGKHAFKLGLNKSNPVYGSKNKNSKINESIALEIKQKFKVGFKQSYIARYFNISKYIVSNVITGKTWNHI